MHYSICISYLSIYLAAVNCMSILDYICILYVYMHFFIRRLHLFSALALGLLNCNLITYIRMHSISYCLNQNLNAIHVVLSFNLQIHSFNIVCFCFFLFSSTPFGSIECFLRFRCSKLSKPLFSLLYFLSATTSTYINIFNICVLYI